MLVNSEASLDTDIAIIITYSYLKCLDNNEKHKKKKTGKTNNAPQLPTDNSQQATATINGSSSRDTTSNMAKIAYNLFWVSHTVPPAAPSRTT